jgi:Tol biopolymer transport system component
LWRAPIADRPAIQAAATRLALPTARGLSPRVGPDYVLFRAPRGGTDGLWRLDDGRSTELWNGRDGRVVGGAAIAPDGKRLAFAGLALNSQIWAQPIDGSGRGRGSAVPLTSDTSRRNSFAAMSPDGAKVAYVSTRGGELPNIWVMDVDGGNRLQITGDDTGEVTPSWLPDGRRVAYASFRGEASGVFVVDIATRREERLFDLAAPAAVQSESKGHLGELQLAPSATQAVFSLLTRPQSRRVLYLTDVRTLTPRALTDGTRSIGYPAWSPDERRIAVEIKDGSSMQAGVVEVESGAVRQLTSERGQTWVRSWSPDGRKIAAAVLRGGVWSLQWIDAQSGETGDITAAEPPHVYVRYPDWSRRNDLVVFERGELRGNIWMLPIP